MPYFLASRFFLLATLLALCSSVWEVSANLILKNLAPRSKTNQLHKREFAEKQYADFQISDGVTGQCRKRASAVFLTPLDLTMSDTFEIGPQKTLAAITKEDYKNLKEMAKVAEKEEEGFNQAIQAHSGDKEIVAKLKAGKIDVAKKNDAERVQKLKEELPKLKKNMQGDAADAGKPMISALSLQKGTGSGSTSSAGSNDNTN